MRIWIDSGAAFSMGYLGSGIINVGKGYRTHPMGSKIAGIVSTVRENTPRTGSGFAMWGLLFASFDCSFAHMRKKEDPLNAIAAGAATSGLLAIRQGKAAVVTGAIMGGLILAMIEGLMYGMGRLLGPVDEQALAEQMAAEQAKQAAQAKQR